MQATDVVVSLINCGKEVIVERMLCENQTLIQSLMHNLATFSTNEKLVEVQLKCLARLASLGDRDIFLA